MQTTRVNAKKRIHNFDCKFSINIRGKKNITPEGNAIDTFPSIWATERKIKTHVSTDIPIVLCISYFKGISWHFDIYLSLMYIKVSMTHALKVYNPLALAIMSFES